MLVKLIFTCCDVLGGATPRSLTHDDDGNDANFVATCPKLPTKEGCERILLADSLRVLDYLYHPVKEMYTDGTDCPATSRLYVAQLPGS